MLTLGELPTNVDVRVAATEMSTNADGCGIHAPLASRLGLWTKVVFQYRGTIAYSVGSTPQAKERRKRSGKLCSAIAIGFVAKQAALHRIDVIPIAG